MHFFQPEQVKHAFTTLEVEHGLSLTHIQIFKKALGKEPTTNKALIAMRVLSESMSRHLTDEGSAGQSDDEILAHWQILHDTVLDVMKQWKQSIETEAALIIEMLPKHAGPMCSNF